MTAKWNGSAWTIAPLPTIPMAGGGAEEPEAEEPEEKDNSLDARLERAADEPDHERQEIFQYLKEFRKKKRLNPWVGRQEQARLEMRAEMYSILREDAERSKRGIPDGGAMANNASEVISYVEDGNGKLVRSPTRKRSPADNIHEDMYVRDENGDLVPYVHPPRRFTQNDRERANHP